jgi:Tfp pilus assembly protein FimT
VEIMIVILIVGILMAIAVPQYAQARKTARLKNVLKELSTLEQAKDLCAIHLGAGPGNTTTCTQAVLVSSDNGWLKTWPTGPVPGTFVLNAIGTAPTFNSKTAEQWQADPTGL